MRLQLQRDIARAQTLREPGALELLASFEEEGTSYFVLTHFYGRALSVQLARGRSFTPAEALSIVRGIGRGLSQNSGVHGAIVPANVLVNDQMEVRLIPALHCAAPGNVEPSIHGDIRQAALLLGHLVFGWAQAHPSDEPRVLTTWTLKPEMPAQYRQVLQFMLAPAGAHYQSWKECLRDLDRLVRGRAVGTARKTSGAGALAGAMLLIALAAAGSWGWHRYETDAKERTGVPRVAKQQPVVSAPAADAAPVSKPVAAGPLAQEELKPIAELQKVPATSAESPMLAMSSADETANSKLAMAKLSMPASAPPPLADSYPGVPKLTLSSAAGAGDPSLKQLAAATQWAIDHGGWRQHREALDQALTAAAAGGGWTQYRSNLQRVLSLPAPSLSLSQDTVLHAIDPGTMSELPKDKDTSEFLAWLFANPRAAALLAETLRPEDKPARVLQIWRDCWKDDRTEAETLYGARPGGRRRF